MTYRGGKSGAGVYQAIINQMPPHETYVEPFLGGGGVMRRKRPAGLNIGIDLDADALQAARAWGGDRVRLWVGDGIKWLADGAQSLDGGDLIYCDPPYLPSTRTRQRIYRHEMEEGDHLVLLGILVRLPCMVMVSGYDAPLYRAMLKGWRLVQFPAMTRGGLRTESLWCNFSEPKALHDYRFLGRDRRERERIRKKAARWSRMLAEMQPLERLAVYSALRADAPGVRIVPPAPMAGTSDDSRAAGGVARSRELAL